MEMFDPLDLLNDAIVFHDAEDGAAEGGLPLEMQTAMDPALLAALQDFNLSVFEEQASATEVGINVSWYSGSNANDLVTFINQLKGARPWDDPTNSGEMTYDENGYPTSVPGNYVTSQLLIRSADVDGIAPMTGAFRLYGQGDGVFSLVTTADGTIANKVDTRGLQTEVIDGEEFWYIDLDFAVGDEDAIGQLKMQIYSVVEGDHIQDLALVHDSHLEAHRAGQVFAPEFIEDLQGYGTLRLMDWMRANRIEEDGNGWGEEGSNWTSPDPEQRYVGTDYFTFNNHAGGALNEGKFEVSVPIEHIVQLANEVGADPWINLPVDISDARAAELAAYVAEHLDEGLTARWEYGNELFNDAIGFEGYRYSVAMAQNTFADFDEEGAWAAVEWAAYRSPQLYEIIRDVTEEAGDEARFVAPGWAFSGSLKDSGELTEGYLVRYFEAAEAQKMNDGTLMPLEIVTDYSVAMYYGGTVTDGRPDGEIAHHIIATVDGAQAQAEALADWLLFASDPETFHELDVEVLEAPLTGLTWSEDLDIGVAPLIWADIQAGLDPLTELESIFRLEDNVLQYQGVNAEDWTDVVVFDAAPGKTLAEMIQDVDFVGYGRKLNGSVFTGLTSSLANSADMRLDAHVGYADALGLNFVAYEGGSHVSYPVEGGFEMYDAFNTTAAGAEVFAKWLEVMSEAGLDEYMHFMSHDRTNGNDWWGVQAYIGQDITGEAEALVIQAAIEAFDEEYEPERMGVLAEAESVATTLTGALVVDLPVVWEGSEFWSVNPDGSATETDGSNTQLRLTQNLPVAGGEAYTFSFDVDLEGVESTEIRVVARAMGGEGVDLIRWDGVVSDGQSVELDLGLTPEDAASLYLVVQRIGADRSGEITVSNADVEQVMPEDHGALEIRDITEGCWEPTNGWRVTENGDIAVDEGVREALTLDVPVPVTSGGTYQVSFTVDLDGADSAQFRVFARAMGGGANQVLSWREDVVDGQEITLVMEDIPADRDLLDVIIRRGGTMDGEVTLTGLVVTELLPEAVEAEPEAEVVESVVPEAEVVESEPEAEVAVEAGPVGDSPVAEDVVFNDTFFSVEGYWTDTGDGSMSIAAGETGFLSLAQPVSVLSGTSYTVSFTVSLDGAESANLRLVGRAMGGGADEVLRWREEVTDGEVVSLTLSEIPEERDLLDLSFFRTSGLEGSMSLSDFSIQPVVAGPAS